MQVTKIALSLAFVSSLSLVSAAPIQEKPEDVVDKRLNAAGLGATIFAGTAIYNGLKGNGYIKEAEEFKQQFGVQESSPEKRLNAAAMIGLTGGAVLKGIFGSKEAADEFLATDQGKEFASKLASVESRDFNDTDEEMEKRLSIPFIGARVLHYLGKIKVSKEALQERSDSPEKRLSWGKAAAGAAAAVVGWFTTKEGQDFLATQEGQDFVSKLAVNDVEARDVDVPSNSSGKRLNAAGIGASVFAATAIYNGLKGNGYIKEAEEFKQTYGIQTLDGSSPEKRLNAAAMIGLTGGAVLKGIFGSKEATDEFLASSEGQEFASKMASIESRDLSDSEKRFNVPVYAKVAGTLAAIGASFTGGYFATKEGQDALAELTSSSKDLQARGKVDYGYLAAGIISAFNAIRARDLDEDVELEKRLSSAASIKWGLGAVAAAFGAGSVVKNIATRDVDVDDSDLINLIRDQVRAEARNNVDDFDLLG